MSTGVIEVDESVDWLTLSPRAAYGSQTVTVSVDPNEGDSRRTVLHFDSYDGVTAEIEIVQASASELIRYAVTGFGDGKVAEPVAIAEYDAMDWTGVGVASTLASGTECRVAVPPVESSYEGASAAMPCSSARRRSCRPHSSLARSTRRATAISSAASVSGIRQGPLRRSR